MCMRIHSIGFRIEIKGRVMSYDLRIAVKVQDTDIYAVIAEPEYSSPTYNIGEMFRKATGWDFEQGKWYKVSDVLPLIEHGIHELRYKEDKYRQYDSPNGWGTTQSARKALESLATCIENQTNGWGWQQIPLEHLYVAW